MNYLLLKVINVAGGRNFKFSTLISEIVKPFEYISLTNNNMLPIHKPLLVLVQM